MQNEPNFKKRQMNLTLYTKRYYAKLDTCSHAKNEPKTNPNEPKRTQFPTRRSPKRVCSLVPETPDPPRRSSLVARPSSVGVSPTSTCAPAAKTAHSSSIPAPPHPCSGFLKVKDSNYGRYWLPIATATTPAVSENSKPRPHAK